MNSKNNGGYKSPGYHKKTMDDMANKQNNFKWEKETNNMENYKEHWFERLKNELNYCEENIEDSSEQEIKWLKDQIKILEKMECK